MQYNNKVGFFDKSESERWNEVARVYANNVEDKNSKGFYVRDNVFNPYLFKAIGHVKGKKILDYGCGDGWLADYLHKQGAIMSACDASDEFIKIAREKHKDIRFDEVPETNIAIYEDNSFDIVISNIVLHITEYMQEMLDEMYRVLKPGGKAVVSFMHPDTYKKEDVDERKHVEVFDITVEGCVPVLYYKRQLFVYENAFKKAGFKIEDKIECLADKSVSDSVLEKYAKEPYFILYVLRKNT